LLPQIPAPRSHRGSKLRSLKNEFLEPAQSVTHQLSPSRRRAIAFVNLLDKWPHSPFFTQIISWGKS
jgi:hypothetical protein